MEKKKKHSYKELDEIGSTLFFLRGISQSTPGPEVTSREHKGGCNLLSWKQMDTGGKKPTRMTQRS